MEELFYGKILKHHLFLISLLVACELLLEELIKCLENYIIKMNDNWLGLNFAYIYHKSFQNNLPSLQNGYNDILVKYLDKAFESEDFFSIPENVLISLIEGDNLQMEEIKIWNYVIKWEVEKNFALLSDLKDGSDEDIQT